MRKGQSRDDIAFLADVWEVKRPMRPARSIPHPESIGESHQDGEMLLIEKVG